jgi:hypothetical protein
MYQRRARSLLPALTFLFAGGCASTLDMTIAYDPGRPATTIPYTSVRGARQFPDYESIGRSILTGVDPAAAVAEPAPAPRSGKSKGGKK